MQFWYSTTSKLVYKLKLNDSFAGSCCKSALIIPKLPLNSDQIALTVCSLWLFCYSTHDGDGNIN